MFTAAAAYHSVSRGAQSSGGRDSNRIQKQLHIGRQLPRNSTPIVLQTAIRKRQQRAISAASLSRRSSQLFLTQFSKDILIPDDE